MDVDQYMVELGVAARAASRVVAASSTAVRNHALLAVRDTLDGARAKLADANAQDMELGRAKALDAPLLDRLELTPARIDAMLEGLQQVAALPDPVGSISDMRTMPSGIGVGRMRVPLGVIGIIYESRPNVTVATADRAAVAKLIAMPEYVDVIVPRGGKGLIERISKDAKVPVIKHLDGVCHVYIDDGADDEMAVSIAVNAKTQRYGTCNTMETLLVAESKAAAVLPRLAEAYAAAGVELRGCPRTVSLVSAATAATEQDWHEEYLAPVLAVRVVADLQQAIEHINTYSSQHTDSIVTRDHGRAMRFLREVDSSSVMINASTRLADGFEYGLGAEIGISTDKLHARGPVGLEGLTSQKFVVLGEGQIRS